MFADAGFFTRRQHHDHLSAFHFGHGFDLAKFGKVVTHPLQHTHAKFLVGHFAAPESQGNLCFVTFFDETTQVAQLDLVVALVGTRTKLDFLDLNDFLLGARLLLALLLLVLELAVVHQATDGGFGMRCNFYQIDFIFFRKLNGVYQRDNAELFSVYSNKSHLWDVYFAIDAMRFIGCDVRNSYE